MKKKVYRERHQAKELNQVADIISTKETAKKKKKKGEK